MFNIRNMYNELWREIFALGQRMILFVPVLIGVGISISYYSNITITSSIVIAIVFLALMIFSKIILADKRYIVFSVFTIISIGILSFSIRTANLNYDTIDYKGVYSVIGTVVKSNKSVKNGKVKSQILLTKVSLNNKKFKSKVRLNVRGDINVGSVVQIKSILYPPAPPIIPDAFDFRNYAKYKEIGAFGKGLDSVDILHAGKNTASDDITNYLYKNMNNRSAGLAIALITGNRKGIEKSDVASLRGSGLAHLLAISGLHIGLIMGAVYASIRLLIVILFGRRQSTIALKKWAGGGSLIVGFMYGSLAGFPIPTVRAFLMASVVVIGVILDRQVFTLRSVALVASVILLFLPESLFSPSFQLSFSAVTALIAVYQSWNSKLKGGISSILVGVFISSSVAMLATIPFSIYHFGTVASYGVISNMIAIPLMGFVIAPALLISVIEMYLLGTVVTLNVADYSLMILLKWSNFIYSIDSSVLHIAKIPSWVLVIIVLGAFLILITKGKFRYVSTGIVMIGIFLSVAIKPSTVVYISPNGGIAVFNGTDYILQGKGSGYFKRAITLQTGHNVKKGIICRKSICEFNNFTYVLIDKVPNVLCLNELKGNLNNIYEDGSKKRLQLVANIKSNKFIFAPNAFIKQCNVASIDKMDLILSKSNGYRIK